MERYRQRSWTEADRQGQGCDVLLAGPVKQLVPHYLNEIAKRWDMPQWEGVAKAVHAQGDTLTMRAVQSNWKCV